MSVYKATGKYLVQPAKKEVLYSTVTDDDPETKNCVCGVVRARCERGLRALKMERTGNPEPAGLRVGKHEEKKQKRDS